MEYKLGMRVYQQSTQYATLVQPIVPCDNFFMRLDNPTADGFGYIINSSKKSFRYIIVKEAKNDRSMCLQL